MGRRDGTPALLLAAVCALCICNSIGAGGECPAENETVGASVSIADPAFALGGGGRSTSGCFPFPQDESFFCTPYLSSGAHYMPDPFNGSAADVLDVLATEEAIGRRMNQIVQASSFVTRRCLDVFAAFMCVTKYPACADSTPLRFNVDVCEFIRDECAILVDGAREIAGLDLLVGCGPEVLVTEAAPQYFFRPDSWLGEPVWNREMFRGFTRLEVESRAVRAAQFVYNGTGGSVIQQMVTGSNVTGDWSGGSAEFDLDSSSGCVPPKVLFRLSASETECNWPREFPVYSEDEWAAMRVAFIVPALLSVPLNLGLLLHATRHHWRKWLCCCRRAEPSDPRASVRRRQKARRVINRLFVATLVAAIAFALVGALPGAILGHDVGYVSGNGLEFEESTACTVSKTAPFLLQMFVFCITATLLKVYARVRAAREMRSYSAPGTERALIVFFCFALPAILCGIAFALEDHSFVRDGQVQVWQYRYLIRNGFMCLPRLEAPAAELMLIHVPLLAAGLLSFGLAVTLAARLSNTGNGGPDSSMHGEGSRGMCRELCGCFRFMTSGATMDRRPFATTHQSSGYGSDNDSVSSRGSGGRGGFTGFRAGGATSAAAAAARQAQSERPKSLGGRMLSSISGSRTSGYNSGGESSGGGSRRGTNISRRFKSMRLVAARSRQPDITARIASQMIRFAFVMLFFLVLGFAGVSSLFPRLRDADAALFAWSDCTQHGGLLGCLNNAAAAGDLFDGASCCRGCDARNGDAELFDATYEGLCVDCDAAPTTEDLFGADRTQEGLPSPGTFILVNLSWSLLPFLFGVLFVTTRMRWCNNAFCNGDAVDAKPRAQPGNGRGNGNSGGDGGVSRNGFGGQGEPGSKFSYNLASLMPTFSFRPNPKQGGPSLVVASSRMDHAREVVLRRHSMSSEEEDDDELEDEEGNTRTRGDGDRTETPAEEEEEEEDESEPAPSSADPPSRSSRRSRRLSKKASLGSASL